MNKALLTESHQLKKTKGFNTQQLIREQLPNFEKRNQIVETINNNAVAVISGGMGCGKNSQVAQYPLEEAIGRGEGSTFRAICIQPNGIVSKLIATKFANERWMEK